MTKTSPRGNEWGWRGMKGFITADGGVAAADVGDGGGPGKEID